jgi:hypothetical protein
MTNSSVLLPDPNVDIKKKVENVVNAVIGEDHVIKDVRPNHSQNQMF